MVSFFFTVFRADCVIAAVTRNRKLVQVWPFCFEVGLTLVIIVPHVRYLTIQ